MTDAPTSDNMVTVLAEILPSAVQALMADHEWDAMARVDRAIALQLATKDARIVLETVLAALTAENYAVVRLPEGVAVAHGTPLVWVGTSGEGRYVIGATP